MTYSHQTMKIPEVCIVGAGMAGLRCAEFLIQGGLPVTIFEARDRIGGRVSSLGSTNMELIDLVSSKFLAWTNGGPVSAIADDSKKSADSGRGCNQIHGTDHNPFVKLAAETATVTFLPEDVHSIFLKGGKHLQGHEAWSLWNAVEDLLPEGIGYSRTNRADISEEISLMDWFSEQVKNLNTTCQQKERMLEVVQDWGGYSGEAIETQSFKNVWLETNMPRGMSSARLKDSWVVIGHLQTI